MNTRHTTLDAGSTRAISERNRPAKLISIVTAFYNEQASIAAWFRAMEEVKNDNPSCRFEFVCVNDGSADRTLELLRSHGRKLCDVRVVDLSRNFGKEAAITAGLGRAGGDASIVIDADLQDPPSLIPAFLEKWREGYDVVYGVRTCRRADSWAKRITARAFYALFGTITDTKLPAGTGDFRLMDRRVVDAFLAMPERNRFLKGLFAWIGFRQTGVEFVRQARVSGKSGWSYLRLLSFAFDGLTGFSIAPLRLASLAGGLVSLLGFAYAMFLIAKTIMQGVEVPGYASVMVVMMFLGGVQLLCLGLIGEYLGRLYIEAKKRPLYVISGIYEDDAVPAVAGPGNLVPLRPISEHRVL